MGEEEGFKAAFPSLSQGSEAAAGKGRGAKRKGKKGRDPVAVPTEEGPALEVAETTACAEPMPAPTPEVPTALEVELEEVKGALGRERDARMAAENEVEELKATLTKQGHAEAEARAAAEEELKAVLRAEATSRASAAEALEEAEEQIRTLTEQLQATKAAAAEELDTVAMELESIKAAMQAAERKRAVAERAAEAAQQQASDSRAAEEELLKQVRGSVCVLRPLSAPPLDPHWPSGTLIGTHAPSVS